MDRAPPLGVVDERRRVDAKRGWRSPRRRRQPGGANLVPKPESLLHEAKASGRHGGALAAQRSRPTLFRREHQLEDQ